ncbi:MAG: DUF6427 family protein [Chitinophagales bacterium]
MLNFFKSNNPAVVIFYLLYLILFRVCLWFVPVDASFAFNYHEPLSTLLFGALQSLGAAFPLVSTITAATLTFIQALLINGMVNDNKITNRKNYLGGLFYIIYISFFPQNLFLSPALIATTFLVLATSKIFGLIKKDKNHGDVFDVGFLVSLSTLFYFPSVAFMLFAYVGLGTVRPFIYREWVIMLLGMIAPVFLCFTIYYFTDRPAPQLYYAGWMNGLKISPYQWINLGCIAIFGVASLVMVPTAIYSSLIQVRKFVTLLAFSLLIILASFFLQSAASLNHTVFIALPFSVIATMVLLQIKNELISEVTHIILILLLLTGQFLPLLNLF